MAKLRLLRGQVFRVMRVSGRANGNLLHDLQLITFQTDNLTWVVRKETDLSDAEVDQDLCTESIISEIYSISEFFVGLDSIQSFFLKFVSMDFGCKTNSASFLAHVNENPCASLFDLSESLM